MLEFKQMLRIGLVAASSKHASPLVRWTPGMHILPKVGGIPVRAPVPVLALRLAATANRSGSSAGTWWASRSSMARRWCKSR